MGSWRFACRRKAVRGASGCILAVAVAVCGCHTSPWSAPSPPALPSSAAGPAEGTGGGQPQTPPAHAPTAPTGQPDPRAMSQVMAEVEALGRTDPALQARLVAELREADPALWPMVAQNFRSRVAYSRQIQSQEALARNASSPRATPWPDPAQLQAAQSAGGAMGAGAMAPVGPNGQPGGPTPQMARLPVANDAALPPPSPQGAGQGQPIQQPPPGATMVPGGRFSKDENAPAIGTESPVQARVAAKLHRDGGVVPAAYTDATADGWRASLDQAMAGLETELADGSTSEAHVADHARLRLLRLAAGRRDEALEPIPGADAAMVDFWSKQVFGLDALLDAQRTPQPQRRASEARRHLAESLTSLGEVASIEVCNLAFCSEVQSYGAVKRFEKYEFTPGQRVLLYAEVENFKSEQSPRGFHTAMASSYQIFDAAGRRVDQQEPRTTEEYCQNPRRDYFLGCDFCLPKRIYPGKHTLKLTVEDQKSKKVGESSIEFTVK